VVGYLRDIAQALHHGELTTDNRRGAPRAAPGIRHLN